MVQMVPRQQAIPKPVARRAIQFTQAAFPKAIERPQILGYNGRGRGVQGEHSNGRVGSEELWRSINARSKPWNK